MHIAAGVLPNQIQSVTIVFRIFRVSLPVNLKSNDVAPGYRLIRLSPFDSPFDAQCLVLRIDNNCLEKSVAHEKSRQSANPAPNTKAGQPVFQLSSEIGVRVPGQDRKHSRGSKHHAAKPQQGIGRLLVEDSTTAMQAYGRQKPPVSMADSDFHALPESLPSVNGLSNTTLCVLQFLFTRCSLMFHEPLTSSWLLLSLGVGAGNFRGQRG
jgi:hypothetical protein